MCRNARCRRSAPFADPACGGDLALPAPARESLGRAAGPGRRAASGLAAAEWRRPGRPACRRRWGRGIGCWPRSIWWRSCAALPGPCRLAGPSRPGEGAEAADLPPGKPGLASVGCRSGRPLSFASRGSSRGPGRCRGITSNCAAEKAAAAWPGCCESPAWAARSVRPVGPGGTGKPRNRGFGMAEHPVRGGFRGRDDADLRLRLVANDADRGHGRDRHPAGHAGAFASVAAGGLAARSCCRLFSCVISPLAHAGAQEGFPLMIPISA